MSSYGLFDSVRLLLESRILLEQRDYEGAITCAKQASDASRTAAENSNALGVIELATDERTSIRKADRDLELAIAADQEMLAERKRRSSDILSTWDGMLDHEVSIFFVAGSKYTIDLSVL